MATKKTLEQQIAELEEKLAKKKEKAKEEARRADAHRKIVMGGFIEQTVGEPIELEKENRNRISESYIEKLRNKLCPAIAEPSEIEKIMTELFGSTADFDYEAFKNYMLSKPENYHSWKQKFSKKHEESAEEGIDFRQDLYENQ